MDKIQEKYRQRASNCCFPQSSHLLLYINIKYQYIPVPSVVRRATRSSIRAMSPGNMDSPIWMVSCYSSQEKKSSQIIANWCKLMSWSRIGDRGCWCMLGESVCKTFQSSILGTKYQPACCAGGCRRSRLRVSTCDLCPWRGFVLITSYGLTNMDTQRRTIYIFVIFCLWSLCKIWLWMQHDPTIICSPPLLGLFRNSWNSWAQKDYLEAVVLFVKFPCSECLDSLEISWNHPWLIRKGASIPAVKRTL